MSLETVLELRRVLNLTIDSVDSLEALGAPIKGWDWLLVPLTSNRLDAASRRDWEILTANKTEPVAFSELKKFMQERLATLELLPTANSLHNAEKDQKKDKIQGRKFDHLNSKNSKIHNVTRHSVSSSDNSNVQKTSVTNNDKQADSKTCAFCSKAHFVAYCYSFKGKSSKDKLDFVKSNKLCFNCLGQHHIKDCKNQKNLSHLQCQTSHAAP